MIKRQACPLCGHACELVLSDANYQGQQRDYWRCEECDLIHVPACFHPSEATAKAIYDLHQNDLNDAGYKQFLQRLATPLWARLAKGASGLDFGAGPGPALVHMCQQQGFRCTSYDLFYAPFPERLQQQYDFVCATEVIEHLDQPAQTIATMRQCVRSGGYLALMTQRWLSLDRFTRWNYRNDLTHIAFFHEHTMHYLAQQFDMRLDYLSADVAIYQTN